MNRSLLAAAVAISGLISLPTWASPQLIWELDGLEAPESALADPEAGVIYVSNVAGDPSAKDGNGYISRVALDGKMLEQRWAIGLDAPKGLILRGDTLFVSDVDRLVAIDTATGKLGGTWTAEGAKFLNDTAVDGQGRIYVSDMLDDAIWVLDGDKFQLFVRDKALTAPNGLFVDSGRLLVAAWGTMEPDWSTKVPGHLLAVDLASKKIASASDGTPIGNLDGLEPDGNGGWLTTDWISGGLIRIDANGRAEKLAPLAPGSADLGILPDEKLVLVPMMKDNKLSAYRLE
jgi:sugar lactone lactonase YvrE